MRDSLLLPLRNWSIGRPPPLTSAILLIVALLLTPAPAWCQSADVPTDRDWGVLLFGGKMSDGDFFQTLAFSNDWEDIYFAGAAVSRRIREGRSIDIELEGGGGYQFADNDDDETGQVWGALYARYKKLPWNHFIYSTVAISTGVNYSFDKTTHEEEEDSDDGTRKLQHYLSPEITFALPEHREWEGVLRLHHRSGVFGLFGCDKCGSNMVTLGVRKRF